MSSPWRSCLTALWLAASGCGVTTDLTVAPPTIHPSFTIDIPPAQSDGRLPPLATPKRYELSFDIDPARERFSGEALIEVELPAETPVIVLHAAELDITRAEISAGTLRLPVDHELRKSAGAVDRAEELVLVAPRALPAGTATVRIAYSAPLRDGLRGLYRVVEGDARYTFTQLEPSDARRLFPCFDDPTFKTPFDVRVTVPKGDLAFSNAPEAAREDATGGRTTFRFSRTPAMPTYLVALATGPLEVREGKKSPAPLRLIATKGKTGLGGAALETAAAELELLGKYFGRRYPYDKLDLVAVPNFGAGAMENAGLVTFREEILLLGDDASATAQRHMATTLAHELAHQWFGNLVTMKWWDDLWLNEGFATFLEASIVDRYKPALGASLELLVDKGAVMDLDALSSAHAVRQPVRNTYEADEAFDGITYVKGASVIRMLESWLGAETFRKGIGAYLQAHEWAGATAADLFDALSAASGKDVASVASTFLDRPGVPIVKAELVCRSGEPASVALSQRRYTGRAAPIDADPPWHIPVCVEWGQRGKATGRDCGLLEATNGEIALSSKGCPEWINPNAGYDGYYHFSLGNEGFAALEQAALKGDARAKIGWLANAWALVQGGELGVDHLLEALFTLRAEKSRAVVEQMIAIATRIADSVVEPSARGSFQAFASALLLPTAKRLGWDRRPRETEDDRLLRHAVLDALAVLTEEPWLIAEAKRRAAAYLQKPASTGADAAGIALRVTARAGEPAITHEALLALAATAPSPEHRVNLVRALGAFREPALLRHTFDLLLTGEIRAQDTLYVMRSAVSWPDSRDVFVDWFALHLPELGEKLPGFGVARLLGAVRGVCDAARRDGVAGAIRPELEKLGYGDRRLSEAVEQASLCIDLRRRQASVASAFLAKRKW